MTDSFNTLPEIDEAIRRTRRIAAGISDPEDLQRLGRYIADLERKRERVAREGEG